MRKTKHREIDARTAGASVSVKGIIFFNESNNKQILEKPKKT